MRRHKLDATKGLDLFLDAICNTFGGIVFISMLVVVLINTTSLSSIEKTTSIDQNSFEDLKKEKAELLEKIVQMEGASRILGDSSEIFKLLQKVKTEKTTSASLRQQHAKLEKQVSKIKSETDKLLDSKKQLEAKKKELNSIEKRLQLLIAKKTKNLKLPKETSSSSNERSFLLKEGRLVRLVDKNIDRSFNGIVPKPGVGIRVSKSNLQKIKAEFAQFNPKTDHIAIAIWEDSFENWPDIQSSIRSEGFSYRIILLQKNEIVRTGASSGKVQQ
jgi:hypothetical protein